MVLVPDWNAASEYDDGNDARQSEKSCGKDVSVPLYRPESIW